MNIRSKTALLVVGVLLAVGHAAPAASAATDTTGPDILMQQAGHFITGSAVTCSTPSPADNYQCWTTMDIRWTASDPSGICDNQVWFDGLRDVPSLLADVGTATHYTGGSISQDVYSEAEIGYSIRSMDCAGNWTFSGRDPGAPWMPPTGRFLNVFPNWNILTLGDQGATNVTYAHPTDWTFSACACFMYGSDLHAIKAGTSVTVAGGYSTYPFALVGPKGPTRGSFKVYEDGVYQGTVSEYSKTSVGSVVLWTHWYQTRLAPHDIKIVVVGTTGHPRVDIDGFLINQ